jgi:hypothetical protein
LNLPFGKTGSTNGDDWEGNSRSSAIDPADDLGAHDGCRAGGAYFNARVEDLVVALDEFKVSGREKKDHLALLGPTKTDIVEK